MMSISLPSGPRTFKRLVFRRRRLAQVLAALPSTAPGNCPHPLRPVAKFTAEIAAVWGIDPGSTKPWADARALTKATSHAVGWKRMEVLVAMLPGAVTASFASPRGQISKSWDGSVGKTEAFS